MKEQGYLFRNAETTHSSQEDQRGLMQRRRFLITSSVGTAGLMLYPHSAAHASPVFWAVARFAAAVGASVLSNLISDYIQQRRASLSASVVREVGRANTEMASSGGFSDLTQSRVYVPQTESSYFFYPARNIDQFNTCVAFLDDRRNQGSERIALIEGPTLFGVSSLASAVAQRQQSSMVRRVMLPRQSVRVGRGTIDRGYDNDDVLSTDEGTVRAHYTTNGNGRGTVTVEARNERGVLLAGGDYDLTYRTA